MKAFKFKQFSVKHHKSGLKIGTDAVLLGAWANLSHKPYTILDIGSGCGVIALMLAQRSYAEEIDAIEINENAFEECVENFENSPYNDRLFCYHADVKDLANEKDLSYDLIVCNPPFFEISKDKIVENRKIARQQITLNYAELIDCVTKLLSVDGEFSVVTPFNNYNELLEIAENKNLFLKRMTYVKGQVNSEVKRCLMQFSFQQKVIVESNLTLEISRHDYTPEYKALVKDFYLKL